MLTCALCASAATLSGCGSDTAVAMTVEGNDIAAGVYINYLLSCEADATTQYKEENPDADTSAEGFKLLEQTIGGVSAGDWIESKTLEKCKRMIAIEQLYDELGLSLTDEDKANINNSANSTWDDENPYLAYYGISFKTMGEYYESLGIGKASYKRFYTADIKESAVFDKLYGTNGNEAVSKDEIDAYAQENYAIARYFKIALTDGNGDAVSTEEGLKVLKDLGNGYVSDMASGATMSEVKAKYDRYLKEQEIYSEMKKAEDQGLEYTGDTIEGINVVAGADDDLESLVKKDGTTPSAAFVTKLFSISEDKPVFFEDEGAYYIMTRCSMADNYEHIESIKSTILHALKDDTFEARLSEKMSAFNTATVAKSIERYSAKSVLAQ